MPWFIFISLYCMHLLLSFDMFGIPYLAAAASAFGLHYNAEGAKLYWFHFCPSWVVGQGASLTLFVFRASTFLGCINILCIPSSYLVRYITFLYFIMYRYFSSTPKVLWSKVCGIRVVFMVGGKWILQPWIPCELKISAKACFDFYIFSAGRKVSHIFWFSTWILLFYHSAKPICKFSKILPPISKKL